MLIYAFLGAKVNSFNLTLKMKKVSYSTFKIILLTSPLKCCIFV